MKPKLIKSDDGSHTLLLDDMEETYHSTHGAVGESRHVFIGAGLDPVAEIKNDIRILEVGFGTGLNVALTVEWALLQPEVNIELITLEPFPLDHALTNELNYPDYLTKEAAKLFPYIHQCRWDEPVEVLPNLKLTKYNQKLEEFSGADFDLIYFDAFAPSRQPDMWTEGQLARISGMTAIGGVLVSYCAQGQFKRLLKSNNFEVEMLPGPPGKREMTRGVKK